MTLIESLALALLHGFSQFVPISAEAHEVLLARVLHFPGADEAWRTTFALAALAALVLYFLHDWLSILSSFLQTLIFRKRPMTLDERFAFFMAICTAAPVLGLWYLNHYWGISTLFAFRIRLGTFLVPILILSTMILHLAGRMNRKSKGPFDLNLPDSALFGLGQALAWFPGCGGVLGLVTVGQLRNYHLEAVTKFASLLSLPFLLIECLQGWNLVQWGMATPFGETSWAQWGAAFSAAATSAFFGVRLLNNGLRRSGFGRLVSYRIVIALILAALQLL